MNTSDALLATLTQELRELHEKLKDVAARRAELSAQMRALEIQTAILRTREQEITRDIERKQWVPVSR